MWGRPSLVHSHSLSFCEALMGLKILSLVLE
ncbi:hypothetical protein CIPAW_05G234400 [Carya illinoinensis]|uniref:Uncharacterized protein n=1 Tax=Carya illinoinensis TaxID=32201 RepID=A0A8T1QN68_CARIL|nr:hypothetical protein CIPAW_05G234400 [Carya illinoinensis]